MTVPPIEQVRGAVAYLKPPPLKRLADSQDSFSDKYDADEKAQAILIAHAEESLAKHDREAAAEDRVERGMLESLCECCGAEIPEDSEYGSDDEGIYCCATCTASFVKYDDAGDDFESPAADDGEEAA